MFKPARGLITVGDFSSFVDGVERLEVEELEAGASTARLPRAPTTEASMASWFSAQDAYATRRITSSGEKAA